MPPIPIHKNDPISTAAGKAESPTDQTAAPPAAAPFRPSPVSANPISTSTSAYPPARPGQPPVPTPTAAINTPFPPAAPRPPPPTKTAPLPSSLDGPAAPQPGAAPIAPPPSSSRYVPVVAPAASPITIPPPQLSLSPPQPNAAPSYSTSTTNAAPPLSIQPQTQPINPNVGTAPTDLSHPPGYAQNPHAADMTASQRAAIEKEGASGEGIFGGFGSAQNSHFGGGVGTAPGTGLNETFGNRAQGAWDAVKGWAGAAAGKVGEVEAEVWRRVNPGSGS